jgi:glycosyltransferase involved in cell wall biosynthesis
MRVSVVIPAYDGARFLPWTIESVQAQTIGDWELVVVDDGSSDETADIACRAAEGDPRIRVISQPNAGIASARNRGLAASIARTEHVIFLDQDDVWEKDALESLLRALNTNPHAVAASGLSRYIDAYGRPIEPGKMETWGRHRLGLVGKRLVEWPMHQPTTFEVLVYRNRIYTTGQMLIRRSALELAGSFDPATSPCEDWDLALRLSLLGEIAFLDKVVLNWRRHDRNASGETEVALRQMAYVRRKIESLPALTQEQHRIARLANRLWYRDMAAGRLPQARRPASGRGRVLWAASQLASTLTRYARAWLGARAA